MLCIYKWIIKKKAEALIEMLVVSTCVTLVGVSPSSSSHSSYEAGGHRSGPGVGVRLNSYQPRGRSSLSQINDRERLKLDKFTSLLSASNVNLGLSTCHFILWIACKSKELWMLLCV